MIVFKIFEKTTIGYKNLFHERSKTFKLGDQLLANVKMVYESYNKKTKEKNMYLSGIHVVESEELCRKYLRRFKNKENKVILSCDAETYGCRPKPNGNKGVYLVTEILLLKELQ